MSKKVTFEGTDYDVPDDATDDEILAFMNQQHPAPAAAAAQPQEEKPQWNPENTPAQVGYDTVVQTTKGMVEPFIHPVDTAKGLYSIVADPKVRAAVGEHFKKRYGSLEGFHDEFVKDPSGVLSELGGLAMGGVGAIRGLAKAGAKVAATAGIKSGTDVVDAAKAFVRNPSKQAPTAGLLEPETDVPSNQLTTLSKPATKADELLYNNLIESGWTPDKITERLKWLGPGATLSDLEPFQGQAMAAAQTPAGAKIARRVLGARGRGAEQRLLTTVDNTLSPANFYETRDNIRATRAAEAKPLRQQALDSAAGKPIKSDMIQRLQKDSPYFNNAMAEGRKIAREEAAREGIDIPTTESWFHGESFDDPNITTMHEPTLRMLDAVKQGYQALLKPYRNEYTGAIDMADPTAVELSKTVDALTKTLRSSSPKYAEYLDKWSEHSQMMDALARGRKVLDNDPEITAQVVRNATSNELLDMQTGLARALKDKISDNPQAAVRLFRKGPVLDKMQAVFPDKQSFRQLHRQVLREAAKQQTLNRTISGSQSIERAQGVKAMEDEASSVPGEAVGAAFDVATKNPVGLTRRIARWALRAKPSMAPDVGAEISSVAHNTDPVAQARQIQRFRARTMGKRSPLDPDELPTQPLE